MIRVFQRFRLPRFNFFTFYVLTFLLLLFECFTSVDFPQCRLQSFPDSVLLNGNRQLCMATDVSVNSMQIVAVKERFYVFMAALRSRCGHYIFILWFFSIFLLLLLCYPRLISAVGDWMSTILPHMVWP